MGRKSKAELEADRLRTIADIDKLNAPPAPPAPTPAPIDPPQDPPAPPVDPPNPPAPADPANPDLNNPAPPSPAPTPAPAAPIQQPEENTMSKKLVSSQREAIVLTSKINKFTGAIDSALNAPDPTEEEMRAIHPNWDTMDDDMRLLAKDNVKSKRALSSLANVNKEAKDIEAWDKKVDEFVDDPKVLLEIPYLEGKQDEFKLFAGKPTRRGVDLKDLVNAFFFELDKKKPKVTPGKMFETPTPGPNRQPVTAPKKLTAEEGKRLRETKYKEWVKAVREGRIEKSFI